MIDSITMIQHIVRVIFFFFMGGRGMIIMAWKEHCVEHWLKELQGSMDSCTGCHDVTEKMLKTAMNTMQSIGQIQSFASENSMQEYEIYSVEASKCNHIKEKVKQETMFDISSFIINGENFTLTL